MQTNNIEEPVWLKENRITDSLDAREMLQRGEHPLEFVLQKAALLSKGAVFELITPFAPFPLIDKVTALGFESYLKQLGSAEVRTYFFKL